MSSICILEPNEFNKLLFLDDGTDIEIEYSNRQGKLIYNLYVRPPTTINDLIQDIEIRYSGYECRTSHRVVIHKASVDINDRTITCTMSYE